MRLTPLQQRRLRALGVILAVGFAYLLLVEWLGRGIPCVFYEVTGLRCPGCGMTRMFRALAHLDFARAAHANAMGLVIAPVLAAQLAWETFSDGKSQRVASLVKWTDIVLLALLFAFGVIRNLPAFSPYLNPA